MNNTQLRAALAIVLAHAAINLVHAAAHIGEGISLPPIANAFVLLVILIAPFVALGLLYTRYQQAGAWLLFGSMFGALVFGMLYHAVLIGPDNVMQVARGPWQFTFRTSAMLLVVTEVIGTLLGGWMLYTLRRSVSVSES